MSKNVILRSTGSRPGLVRPGSELERILQSIKVPVDPTWADEPPVGSVEAAFAGAWETSLNCKECDDAKGDFQKDEEQQVESSLPLEEANDCIAPKGRM